MKQPAGKRILKVLRNILLVQVLLIAGVTAFYWITEFRPKDRETMEVIGEASAVPSFSDEITLVTWNTGYGALGDSADFFMDGGTMVYTADEERVRENLAGMTAEISELDPDLILLQETDRDSDRSYHIDEAEYYASQLPGTEYSSAYYHRVVFLPYPWPPVGRANLALATLSYLDIAEAERIQLPIPFKWPVSMLNLKRGVLITRIGIGGTDRQLAVVNLHLEAYDDGEGKTMQTEMLKSILQAEYNKGNYVIAGGDFNQIFSDAAGSFPVQEDVWQPGAIDLDSFGDDFTIVHGDTSVPTCRSLDRVYAGADHSTFQYYLIDGFIVSANVQVESCETIDLDFVNTDHNPVVLKVTLQ